MIKNPILTGSCADPCICRKGEDYYIAVSSFEWFPGIPVYRSRDLIHWELYTHVLTDESVCDLKRFPPGGGVHAPCLTYCEEEKLFYVVYGIMYSMNTRYFDIDNYLITAPDIKGPWSEPVYLHSVGFDASLMHDDNGRKWLVSLEWETRLGYEESCAVCIVEYDPVKKAVKGYPKHIWRGGTDRGILEAPRLTKHGGMYYLMCSEGGAGYYNCITMARSAEPFSPYVGDPANPILTSAPEEKNERADTDHIRPRYYNPASYLQKCGHGSCVETASGETYLVHNCARPFTPELRCSLGRETAIQKMAWTEDGWLRLACGGNVAQTYVEKSSLPEHKAVTIPEKDDFDGGLLGAQYYAPRIDPESFCDLASRPGWLRMRGQGAPSSLNRVSILARRLTSVNAEIVTHLDFHPEDRRRSAGLILYCGNMNYAYLRKYFSETLGCPALSVVRMNNGKKAGYISSRRAAPDGMVWMRLRVRGREAQFGISFDGQQWEEIGPAYDTSEFSEEYSRFGESSGCFVGLTCCDLLTHTKCADFDCFIYRDIEPELLIGAPMSHRDGLNADTVQKDLRRRVRSLSADMRDSERTHNSYEQERREQECIRLGDVEGFYRAVSEVETEKVGRLSKDDLRHWKNTAIVVISLSSRSAIEGGLSPETAYSMSDVFIQRIEEQTSLEKITELCRKAELEYCLAVCSASHSASGSPIVLRCRDIVSRRIHTRITVSELAEALKINPDYLSQLFAREEGITLSEYIAREKVKAAAGELIFSQKTFGDIAASLGYSSQSHLGRVFKKWTGMTLGQYRRLYGENTDK